MTKKNKFVKIEWLKQYYFDGKIEVDEKFVKQSLNKIYPRDSKIFYKKNVSTIRKIYTTSKNEDSLGYSDYLLNVKKLSRNQVFVEESEIHPFESDRKGNPYMDPKINIEKQIKATIKSENGEEKTAYINGIGVSPCRYGFLLKNTISSLKSKCSKKYIQHDNKGILFLTERMYLELYVQTHLQKEKKLLTKKPENYNFIEQAVGLFIYKFMYDIKKHFTIEELENSQFEHIYIAFNFYGKPAIVPLLPYLLYDGLATKGSEEIVNKCLVDIKGKREPLINAIKV